MMTAAFGLAKVLPTDNTGRPDMLRILALAAAVALTAPAAHATDFPPELQKVIEAAKKEGMIRSPHPHRCSTPARARLTPPSI
jgi:hypothetical protein